jgi:TonB-linked SusC/RagA family outer membrane protein
MFNRIKPKTFKFMKFNLIRKIIMISKYTLFGIFLQVICYSFLLAAETNAQQNKSVKEVAIDLKIESASIAEIFRYIESNTAFYFSYDRKDIDGNKVINFNDQYNTVADILMEISRQANLKFKQVNQNINVNQVKDKKGLKDRTIIEVILQSRTITGRITSREDGEGLPGANVIEKGTSNGTITDLEGRYSLNVSEGATLVFGSVGYTSEEIEIGNRTMIDLVMIHDIWQLDELVVVGYGTQKKMNLTGSVASVSGEALDNKPLPNVGEVLRGVSPNLYIGLSGYGGEPGSTRTWNIRGMGSIRGNDSPLILVDGVEMDINNLDPGNIESVSVLKDASASAIYGARAPFGVVLITTKTGKKGPVRVQYNNNLTFGTKLGIPHMENSLIFATVFNHASANAGSPPIFPDEQIERIKGFMDGTFPYEYDPNDPPNAIWAGRRSGNANYDWPHELLKPLKIDQRHNINISGGDDKTKYYVSLGLFDEDGFYAVGYDDYKRHDVLANFKTEVTNWLRFDLSTKYANSQSDYPHGITTVERRYFFTNLYIFGPNTPKYNINGSSANPMLRSIDDDAGRIRTVRNDFLVTIGSEIEPIKGWKTRVSYNYNVTGMNEESNPKPIWVELGTGGFGNVGKPIAAYEGTFSHSPYSLFNTVTSYEKSIGNHNFNALAGYEQEEKFYTWLYARADNLITEEVPSISTALGAKTVNDAKWDWSTQGVFGRFNYNFKEKYLVEFSARYNGSSRFAPESRWGFFPSASAGYNISKENFWASVDPYISSLKIRGSYGSLGNQNVSNYLYISSVNVLNETPWIIGGQRLPYAQTPGLISDNLTWETITTLNLGIDAGFLNNRLGLVFDWFERKTTNMFGPQETLPYTLGTSTPLANNAELLTKGFEVIASWKDRISSDFSYNAQISLGDNKTTILKYRNESGLIDSWYAGKDVGEIWGLVTDRIIQNQEDVANMPNQSAIFPRWSPGDIMYKDLNGDDKITYGARTLDDHGDLTVIGNTTPRYNFGIAGGFNWKGFDFNMHWLGLGKRDFIPSRSSVTFWGLTNSWSTSGVLKGAPVLDYWRPETDESILGPNTNAYFAKPYFGSETWKNRDVRQTRYVLNAAYMRLKSLQVGYTVPATISNRAYIQRARIFISGENLLTFTSLPKAMDPEQTIGAGYTSSGAFYPIARSFSLGLNVTF